MNKMKNQNNDKYGWYVVAASFVMLFFGAGAQYAFGVMFKPIIAEFGWGRSTISFVFFVNMMIFAAGLTIAGKLYDRYGPKWIIIVSTLFITSGFILTSFTHSFGQFFFSYGILAAAGPAGMGVPLISTLVTKWFSKWRGLALSLALAGASIGAFIIIPILSLATITYGWRISFRYLGIVVLIVNTLIAIFIIKGDPRHLGRKAFGEKGPDNTLKKDASEKASSDTSEISGLGLAEALKTRSFWLFLIVMFICGSGDYFASTHFINFATDYGISAISAGKMMGWFGLMGTLGMLLTGPAADRIGIKIPIFLTFLLRVLLFVFIFEYKSTMSLYVFALLFGFTLLITAPLAPMLVGKLYGFKHLGILTGIVNTVHFIGGGIWPYIVGLLFDRTGNYQLAFIFSAAMAMVAVACTLPIIERRHVHNAPPPGIM